MTVRLRRMSQAEWEPWWAAQHAGYVDQMVRFGGRRREDAEAKATRDQASLVPDGFASRGQHFFVVEAQDGRRVGTLWLGEPAEDAELLWVYEVEIEAEQRRRGHGGAAMVLAEDVARELGKPRIGLNVFADNHGAIALYESLGYRTTERYEGGRNMVKDVPAR